MLSSKRDDVEARVDFKLSQLSVDGFCPWWVLHRFPERFGNAGIWECLYLIVVRRLNYSHQLLRMCGLDCVPINPANTVDSIGANTPIVSWETEDAVYWYALSS